MQLVEPRPRRPLPIRMTPLIDVVFILLVFFMLTSRLLPVGSLELGNATPNGKAVIGEPTPELMLTATGRVLWQDQPRNLDELLTALAEAGVTEVNLATQPKAGLSDFTRTLSRLEGAGITTHWKRASEQTP